MAAQAPQAELGFKAPPFTLPATDGKTYSLADLKGERGTVVMFICNHCPYVQAVIDRVAADARALAALGVNCVAICSNDAVSYPEDSFANMRAFAKEHALPFPYLHDETQDVARAYGAVCTPDFFGFNDKLELALPRPARRGAHRAAAQGRQARAARRHDARRPRRAQGRPSRCLASDAR